MANYLAPDASGIPKSVSGTAVSAGAGDAGKIVQLNSNGLIDDTMAGSIARAGKNITTGETIASGARVYVDSAGVVRNADASNPAKLCTGYVEAGAASGATVKVYTDGIQTGLSGLTAGTPYYLSGSTPGAITTTAPTTAGHTVQRIGVPISATELNYQPEVLWTN